MKARIIPIQDGSLKQGTPVIINYESITKSHLYEKKTEKYKDWIEENKDTVFTIWENPYYRNRPDLTGLSKGKERQIWLLTWDEIIPLSSAIAEKFKDDVDELPICTTCYEDPAIEGTTVCVGCRDAQLKEDESTETLEELIEAM